MIETYNVKYRTNFKRKYLIEWLGKNGIKNPEYLVFSNSVGIPSKLLMTFCKEHRIIKVNPEKFDEIEQWCKDNKVRYFLEDYGRPDNPYVIAGMYYIQFYTDDDLMRYKLVWGGHYFYQWEKQYDNT